MADDPIVIAVIAAVVFVPVFIILAAMMLEWGGIYSYLAIIPVFIAMYMLYDKVGKLFLKKK